MKEIYIGLKIKDEPNIITLGIKIMLDIKLDLKYRKWNILVFNWKNDIR